MSRILALYRKSILWKKPYRLNIYHNIKLFFIFVVYLFHSDSDLTSTSNPENKARNEETQLSLSDLGSGYLQPSVLSQAHWSPRKTICHFCQCLMSDFQWANIVKLKCVMIKSVDRLETIGIGFTNDQTTVSCDYCKVYQHLCYFMFSHFPPYRWHIDMRICNYGSCMRWDDSQIDNTCLMAESDLQAYEPFWGTTISH